MIENAKKMEERLALYESRVQAVIPIERPRMEGIIIPDIACGHEEDYHLFMRGRLVYRPDPKSDEGMITLPIANLINPLGGYPEGTFDLSGCGYTGQYLSINAGYRKGKITDNANKVEIWFVPRFMVFNQNQQKFPTPPQFKDIEDKWTHPVGIFWTWGGWDNLSWYDYLTNGYVSHLHHDLNQKWHHPTYTAATHKISWRATSAEQQINFKFCL